MKLEQWGSPLVQEKYQEEKVCDKRHPYRIIIIITRFTIRETSRSDQLIVYAECAIRQKNTYKLNVFQRDAQLCHMYTLTDTIK